MKAQIIYRIRASKLRSVDLPERQAVLGAESSADVPVPVEGVSRHHARLLYDAGTYWLEDLRSTNGTFVNGRLTRRTRLRHLDVITLGRLADLVFVLRDDDFAPMKIQGIIAAQLIPLAEDEARRDIPLGEITFGRAEACNVALEESAISKLHARIERSADQLVFEDLGSVNGSAVNGSQVSSAVLRHDDEIALAGVARYRIAIELGDITKRSGVWSTAETAENAENAEEEQRPQLSTEWKTRFEWSTGEYAALAEIRREREGTGGAPESSKRIPAVRPAPEGKPAPVAKAPEPPRKPVPIARPEPRRQPVPAAKPAPPRQPAPVPVEPPTTAPAPKPGTPRPQDGLTPEQPHRVAASAAITRIRFQGSDVDLSVSDTGHHPLGRATNAAIRVKHPTVSRRHAVVILSDNRESAFLQDDGGSSGTLLNGREIMRTEPLRDGDEITIGEVSLKVTLERS